MEFYPIDLVALVSAILGICIVLVPVVGLTARFALKPIVEALGRYSQDQTLTDTVQLLLRRIELQEQELDSLQVAVRDLKEVSDFGRQLRGSPDSARLPSPEKSPGAEGTP